jgi:nitrogen regulatory protein PII
MKEIKVVGQPFFLLKIVERMRCLKEPLSITVSEILDFGGLMPVRTSKSEGDFVKRWRLEVIVPDAGSENVLQEMRDCARSEREARTQIFLSQVEEVRNQPTSSQSSSADGNEGRDRTESD